MSHPAIAARVRIQQIGTDKLDEKVSVQGGIQLPHQLLTQAFIKWSTVLSLTLFQTTAPIQVCKGVVRT